MSQTVTKKQAFLKGLGLHVLSLWNSLLILMLPRGFYVLTCPAHALVFQAVLEKPQWDRGPTEQLSDTRSRLQHQGRGQR